MISILSAEDPDIEELNSQEFQRAVKDKAFVIDPAREEDQLTVRDEDQTVTGLLKQDSGQPRELEYAVDEIHFEEPSLNGHHRR